MNYKNSKFMILVCMLGFCFIDDANADDQPDIYSIISDHILQRKTVYNLNPEPSDKNITDVDNVSSDPKRTLSQYLSAESQEISELEDVGENQLKGDTLSLRSAHVELLSHNVVLHQIVFEDFDNFKKSSIKLQTIVPDGSDPNTIKIMYEASNINDIVLSGQAEINGSNYDFILNITEPNYKAEYLRTPASEGAIKTKSVLETFSLKKFTLIVEQTNGTKLIESPNREILQRLADSWLVTISDAVTHRFVKPKVFEQSRAYFGSYKKRLLRNICSTILSAINPFTFKAELRNNTLISQESEEYVKYSFVNVELKNFDQLDNCWSDSTSFILDKNSCLDDNSQAHNLLFIFTRSANTQPNSPSVNWVQRQKKFENSRDHYSNYKSPEIKEDDFSATISYWSVKLTIFTDKNGRKTSNEIKTDIDIVWTRDNSAKSSNYVNGFFEILEKNMKSPIESLINLDY